MNQIKTRIIESLCQEFDLFYGQFCDIPRLAKQAFEVRNHRQSLQLSSLRLQLYSVSIKQLSEEITTKYPVIRKREALWNDIEQRYREITQDRYHSDLSLAYLHSVRRKIYLSEWRAEDYSSHHLKKLPPGQVDECYLEIELNGRMTLDTMDQVLDTERFAVPYEDKQRDAQLILKRVRRNLKLDTGPASCPESIQMFKAGFYRNRGGYLVGRFGFKEHKYRPFIIALLNGERGIYADAVITSITYAHNMFSSTLANFHVTNHYYHELCAFLKSIMPMRPIGLHYSTIGYNHLGKVAVINEIEQEIRDSGERLTVSQGARGTVSIGFATPGSAYHLKVVRNVPTAQYKWGKFEGVESVLKKYTEVHQINRTDSMLDSIIFYKLRVPKIWFDVALLREILTYASHSVIDDDDAIIFRYLIVQRKLIPLPVYLKTASAKQAETVMINLGYCIKNNAAANIFNKDLDARNYGVTMYSKVYLYDYDALEVLSEVKIRTNLDRVEGEEEIPDWYFEEGVVFLPEELTTGLCLPYRSMRHVFNTRHQALLGTRYWEAMQDEIARGIVPRVSVYPDSEKLEAVNPNNA